MGLTSAWKQCLTLGILCFNLPHGSFAHLQHSAMDPSSFLDYDITQAPSTTGKPMGAGDGYGCSYVCEGNFDDIMETWDHFST